MVLGVGGGVLAGCSTGAGGAAGGDDALPACSSLKGKTVSLLVGSDPSGMGQEPQAWLTVDVPWVRDVPMTDEQRSLIDAHLALIELGRPLVGPPGIHRATEPVVTRQ